MRFSSPVLRPATVQLLRSRAQAILARVSCDAVSVDSRTMSSVGSSVRRATADRRSGPAMPVPRPPELEGGQADGGQRRVEVARQRDVVEAHDRDVVGHPAMASRRRRRRRGRPRRWPTNTASSMIRPSSRPFRRVRRWLRRSHPTRRGPRRTSIPAASSAAGTRAAVRCGRIGQRRIGDAGDPPMAQRDQVVHGPGAAAMLSTSTLGASRPGREPWSTTGNPSRSSASVDRRSADPTRPGRPRCWERSRRS